MRLVQTRFRCGSTVKLSLAANHNSLAHYAKGTRSRVGQAPAALPLLIGDRVSGSLSLPSTGCFSPFPHGTGSLSVSGEYLALDDGPPRFTQGFTCPELLRIPPGFAEDFDYRALTFCGRPFQAVRLSRRVPMMAVLQPQPAHRLVWATPRSLAATKGISVDFCSCGYLDVSVPRVRSIRPMDSAAGDRV